jgi:acetyltransferase-like isoleucine patch superfamily enzyme
MHDFDLRQELAALMARMREERWARWRRVLPVGDELSDRWEKARFLGFGEGASIYDSSLVIGDVRVGRGTWIGPFTVIDGSGGVEIGDWCSIAAGVQIYSHDSVAWALTGGKAAYRRAPTRIGDCCYVGPLSVIARGASIGNRCVIASHSLVTGAVPDFSIAAGTPAKVIGRVEVAGDEVTLRYEDGESR